MKFRISMVSSVILIICTVILLLSNKVAVRASESKPVQTSEQSESIDMEENNNENHDSEPSFSENESVILKNDEEPEVENPVSEESETVFPSVEPVETDAVIEMESESETVTESEIITEIETQSESETETDSESKTDKPSFDNETSDLLKRYLEQAVSGNDVESRPELSTEISTEESSYREYMKMSISEIKNILIGGCAALTIGTGIICGVLIFRRFR